MFSWVERLKGGVVLMNFVWKLGSFLLGTQFSFVIFVGLDFLVR